MSSHIEIEGQPARRPRPGLQRGRHVLDPLKVTVNDRIKQQDDTYASDPAVVYWA